MRNVFISAENDTLLISLLNLRNPNALIFASDFVDFSMNEPRELPYVSDYLVDFDETVEELRRFIGTSVYKGFMKLDYLIVLPDDCTNVESSALDNMLHFCGAKDCISENRAFLLSKKPEYLAVTESKRCVTVTHVTADAPETEQVFLDVNSCTKETIQQACKVLDELGELPVYTYGLRADFQIGTPVSIEKIMRNFVSIQ